MDTDTVTTPAMQPDHFLRLPGLFRRWEIAEVLDGADYHIEEAGKAEDGTQLYAVYRLRDADGIEVEA